MDDSRGCAIKDPSRLSTIKDLLYNVLRGSNHPKTARKTLSPPGVTNRDRRLHQSMLADRDYERIERAGRGGFRDRDKCPLPHVTIIDCLKKDYNVVTMRAKD
ncbi:ACT domain-containing protein ACR4 [Spatholobus suberectus]|nr:ACT domain-containing protein ACR4 [Spatholobus suberectus]